MASINHAPLPFFSSCDVADALQVLRKSENLPDMESAGYVPDIHLWSPQFKAGNTRGNVFFFPLFVVFSWAKALFLPVPFLMFSLRVLVFLINHFFSSSFAAGLDLLVSPVFQSLAPLTLLR
jgi:hypothetical protein